jgi:hypothetical protein
MFTLMWRKYASRFLLVIVLVAFLGCAEGESCEGPPQVCGADVEIRKGFTDHIVLTDSNPSIRVITDDACALGGAAVYKVYYRYHDVPEPPRGTYATPEPKNKPSLSVKFGTLEKGAKSQKLSSGFVDTSGQHLIEGADGPPKVKEGTNPAPIHYVLSVTMLRPLIRLGGKTAPTIALPFIGQIIGPQPRDVDVWIVLTYQQPLPAKPAK